MTWLLVGLLVLLKNKGGGWRAFVAASDLCPSLLFVCSCLWFINVIPPKLTQTVYSCPDAAASVLAGTSSAVCSSVRFSVGSIPDPAQFVIMAGHVLPLTSCSGSAAAARRPAVPLAALHLHWFHSTMMLTSAANTSASNYCCESGSSGRHF